MRATQMTGQLARHYGLPLRSSGRLRRQRARRPGDVGDLEQPLGGGAEPVEHRLPRRRLARGRADRLPEKFVMDCEVLQMIQRYFEEPLWATTEDDIAFDAITRGRPERALLRRLAHPVALCRRLLRALPRRLAQLRGLADRRRGLDGRAGAQASTRQIIAEFEPPAMDGDHQEELRRLRRPSQGRGRRADRFLNPATLRPAGPPRFRQLPPARPAAGSAAGVGANQNGAGGAAPSRCALTPGVFRKVQMQGKCSTTCTLGNTPRGCGGVKPPRAEPVGALRQR